MSLKYNKPKGTQDLIGNDIYAWQFVENEIRKICKVFGINEIRTPIYESTDLFVRGVGETTDIVTKEMFSFTDAGERSYTLRPEGTVNAARAYIENGMSSEPQPLKWYYISPTFRAERPQKGRYRQFTQFGVEYFGTYSPYSDAELISVYYELLKRLKIGNIELRINSLGGNQCREKYNQILKEYIGENIESLCPICQERSVKNPLRVLDCKIEACKNIIADAPPSINCLDDECKKHFDGVCQCLDNMNIPYTVDPLIVRGLDYYTRTVFEFVSPDLGAQSTVCGGGRYDNLISDCGGAKTGAVGFGCGLERLVMILQEKNLIPKEKNSATVYIGSMGEKGAKFAQKLVYELRKQNIYAECDTVERSVKAQLKYADKINAIYTVILGDSELDSGVVKIKKMMSGEEIECSLDEIVKNIECLSTKL